MFGIFEVLLTHTFGIAKKAIKYKCLASLRSCQHTLQYLWQKTDTIWDAPPPGCVLIKKSFHIRSFKLGGNKKEERKENILFCCWWFCSQEKCGNWENWQLMSSGIVCDLSLQLMTTDARLCYIFIKENCFLKTWWGSPSQNVQNERTNLYETGGKLSEGNQGLKDIA